MITRVRQQAWADTPLACAARSARGLFLLRRPRAWSRASRSVGRPHPSPPHPSAPAPTHRSATRRPPPCAPQMDRASEPALASEALSCSAIPPRLPTRAAACVFEPASATPGRTVGAQGRGPPTGVRGGIARPRRQRSPEARSSSNHPAPRYRGRPLAFRSLGPARVRALRAELSFMCIHSAPRGWDT